MRVLRTIRKNREMAATGDEKVRDFFVGSIFRERGWRSSSRAELGAGSVVLSWPARRSVGSFLGEGACEKDGYIYIYNLVRYGSSAASDPHPRHSRQPPAEHTNPAPQHSCLLLAALVSCTLSLDPVMSWERARKTPWKALSGVEDSVQSKKRVSLLQSSSLQSSSAEVTFDPSASFQGSRPGFVFGTRDRGTGYYTDLSSSTSSVDLSLSTLLSPTSQQWEWFSLFRSGAFGGCVGLLTGSGVGFLDSMRQIAESSSNSQLKALSNTRKGNFVFQGMQKSGIMFGTFFAGYHATKYTVRVLGEDYINDWGEIGLATFGSLAVLGYKQRAMIPYGIMMIGMDMLNLQLRDEKERKERELLSKS